MQTHSVSIPSFTCGKPDIVVPARGSAGPLAPGTYGALTLMNGSRITLAPGTFQFCLLNGNRNVRILTTGALQSTINVSGSVRLANGSSLRPDGITPTPEVNVGGASVRLRQDTFVQAFLSAPNAALRLGRRAKLVGTFCVDSANSDKGINLMCSASPGGAFIDADEGL